MIEYQQHLEQLKSEYYITYTTTFSETEWGNEILAKQYLEKYWLEESEYKTKWLKIQNGIFDSSFRNLPQKLYLDSFELIPNIGGVLFGKEDFEALKLCFRETGDKYFVIIQNSFGIGNFPAFSWKLSRF